MKADIIIIGDEILIGHTIDTNSSWIGNFLENNGIQVNEIRTVSDNKISISSALSNALKQSNFVFITGGLGPTKDDITKQTLCDFFNDKLILNKKVLLDIKKNFESRKKTINKLTKYQAYIPSKCEVITNEKGTAPGMWFKYENNVVVSMPGVHYEMKSMMKIVLKKIKQEFKLLEIVHKKIFTRGIIESHLAELIFDWESNLPKEINLSYLPSNDCLILRLTARGYDRLYLENLIKRNVISLKSILGPYFSKYQTKLNEVAVGQFLKKNKYTLSTAESCTGGNIARMITSVKGSSTYFKGSLVAYFQNIKENILSVKSETISNYGIVSEEVVREMAQCSKKLFVSDFAISTSGLADLNDYDDVKGGTICIAIATPNDIFSQTLVYNSDRETNIVRASNAALNFLLQVAEKH